MTTINWIILGLTVVSVGLYIFALIKNFGLLRNISSCFILPLAGTFITHFLFNYLPDSRHIIISTIVALFFCTTIVILSIFDKNTIVKIFFNIILLCIIASWMELYKSTYFIYRVPAWLYIIGTVVYTTLTVLCCIFSGKQKPHKYLHYTIACFAGFVLNFSSLVMLCFSPCTQTILLFAGTTTTCALIIFHILNYSKFNFKYYRQLSLTLLILSQSLILVSNIYMIK